MRIALISDVHANLPALEAVVEDARVASAQQFVCAGDVVGFGPHAKGCLDMVRGLCQVVVRGNHDHALYTGEDCRCSPALAPLARAAEERARQELDGGDIAWLRGLAHEAGLYLGGQQLYAVHGRPSDTLYSGVKPDAPPDHLRLEFSTIDADFIVLGHTHRPMVLRGVLENATLINPGSVGFPLDGDPRAAYALLDTESGEVHPRRLPYDLDRTLADLSYLPPDVHAIAERVIRQALPP